MNTTVKQPSTRRVQNYRQKERIVFSSIPGMAELSQARDESHLFQLRSMYPDAAFAQMIAMNLFCPNRELNNIYLRAYQAILEGESIDAIRFRFNKDIDTHWANHMWDD